MTVFDQRGGRSKRIPARGGGGCAKKRRGPFFIRGSGGPKTLLFPPHTLSSIPRERFRPEALRPPECIYMCAFWRTRALFQSAGALSVSPPRMPRPYIHVCILAHRCAFSPLQPPPAKCPLNSKTLYTCVHFGAPVRFSGLLGLLEARALSIHAHPLSDPQTLYTCMHFGAPVRFFTSLSPQPLVLRKHGQGVRSYIHVCILAHRCAFSSAGPLLPLALVAFHVSALQWHVMRPSNVYTCVHFGAPVRFFIPPGPPGTVPSGPRNVYTCMHFGAPVRFFGLSRPFSPLPRKSW